MIPPIEEALAEQHDELGRLLDGLGQEDWTKPSPCEGWSVADVVLHLIQTDDLALASATGRFPERVAELGGGGGGGGGTVDDGAARMVERERGLPPDELRRRWRAGADELRRVLADADPHERVTWVAGQLSVRTLTTTRLAECWIHTGDVAAAVGAELPTPDRVWHLARLAWRTLPYAFARADRTLAGPVAFELTGPGGDEWTFKPDGPAATVVRGPGVDLVRVAARRVEPGATDLRAEGPDGDAVLELVRTYA